MANIDGKTEQTIYRCDMSGKNPVKLVSTVDYIAEFTIDGNYFYYVIYKHKDLPDMEKPIVYRKNLKTGSTKKVYTSRHWITDICADGKNLYFIENIETKDDYDCKLKKLNTAAGKSTVIKKNAFHIRGVFDERMVIMMDMGEDGKENRTGNFLCLVV